MATEHIGIEQARGKLGELADRARFGGETFVLTKMRKPVAVIVSYEEFRDKIEGEDQR
jgi:prevent-host-death family protein